MSYLRRVGGLTDAVVALAGVGRAALASRAGWDAALSRIKDLHPDDGLGPPRLTLAPQPSAVMSRDLARARCLAEAFPGVLDMNAKMVDSLSGHGLAATLAPGWTLAETASREKEAWAFVRVNRVALRAGLTFADVRDDRHLEALLAKVRRGGRREAGDLRGFVFEGWGGSVRYALLDARRDAVALAHAARSATGRGVEVAVLGGSRAAIRRGRTETGVRTVDAHVWHPDPATSRAMAEGARLWCLRHAVWRVEAPDDAQWLQAVVRELDERSEAHVLWRDGRVTAHRLDDPATAPFDPMAVAIAAVAVPPVPMPDEEGHVSLPSGVAVVREDQGRGSDAQDACPALRAFVADLPRSRRVAYAETVAHMATRGSRVAVLTFEEAVPPALREVASHVVDLHDRLGFGARGVGRVHLLAQRLRALVVASGHRDAAAIAAAVRRVPVLAAVARCDPGWRGASEVLAAGGRDDEALRRFASDVTGWPASRHVAKVLRAFAPSPEDAMYHLGVLRVAVALAVGAPSRPVLDLEGLGRVEIALHTLDASLDPLDPVAIAAAVDALSTGVGPEEMQGAATGIRDVWRAFGRHAAGVGMSEAQAAALREEAMLPKGRNPAGLARISEAWHRRTVREERERFDLVARLSAEESRLARVAEGGDVEPWAFPAPFVVPILVDGVEVVPLRDDVAFLAESERQSSCVASYRGDARTGRLVVHSLRSKAGWSTAGHWVNPGADGGLTFRLFQHEGDQASATWAAPDAHVRVMDAVVASLADPRRDAHGDPGWRDRMTEARRLHALRRTEADEGSLTGDRRATLRALDLTHLGRLLGRREAALDADALVAHAGGLVAARVERLTLLRERTADPTGDAGRCVVPAERHAATT